MEGAQMKQTQTKSKKAGSPRTAPKTTKSTRTPKATRTRDRDPRLPAAGTFLTRTYKGKDHRVKVLEQGLEYEGAPYRSLTALAQKITGYPAISGPAFFRLTGSARATPKVAKSKEKPSAPKGDATKADPATESATA
jgi:DUF2924 family protein